MKTTMKLFHTKFKYLERHEVSSRWSSNSKPNINGYCYIKYTRWWLTTIFPNVLYRIIEIYTINVLVFCMDPIWFEQLLVADFLSKFSRPRHFFFGYRPCPTRTKNYYQVVKHRYTIYIVTNLQWNLRQKAVRTRSDPCGTLLCTVIFSKRRRRYT